MIMLSGFDDDPAVVRWLAAYESTHFKRYALKYFVDFLHGKPGFEGVTPSGLVEFQRRALREGREYELVDLLQEHIRGCKGTYRGLLSRWDAVRSFFRRNRAGLPSDAFNIRPSRESVQGKLTVEIIKSLVSASGLDMKAFYLTLWMGVMDQERFQEFNLKCGVRLVEHLKTKGLGYAFLF
jgi:hypothetical protein